MYDVIVVGMGAAGMSAGIYLKRSNLNVLLIDSLMPGGILNKVSKIENYLGFKSISGSDLAFSMFEHINNEKIDYKITKVLRIENNNNEITVYTPKGEFKSKSLILATGRKLKKSGILNEEEFVGKGISYCASCDGSFYKDKKVIVIGNDNISIDEAIYLKGETNDVTFISDKEIDDSRLKSNNIKLINNKKVIEFYGEDKLLGLKLEDNTNISCDGAFIYSGYNSDSSFMDNIEKDNQGYIIVDKNMKTNIDNIYACGDAIKKDLYQVSTAVAEGAIAATNINKYLKEEKC